MLILNLSGLVLLVVSFFAALFAGWAAGSVAVFFAGLAALWFVFGGRRKPDPATGAHQSAFWGRGPTVFRVPMRWLAVLPLVLCAPGLAFDRFYEARQQERVGPDGETARLSPLERDLTMLRRLEAGGDKELSEGVRAALADVLGGAEQLSLGEYHVYTRRRPGRVLALVQTPDLKHFDDSMRETLLIVVQAQLWLDTDPETEVYAGLVGRVALGAVLLPGGVVETGAVVPRERLEGFYIDSAAAMEDGGESEVVEDAPSGE